MAARPQVGGRGGAGWAFRATHGGLTVGAVGVLATVGWALRQDVAVHSQTSRAAVHGGQKCWLGGEAERLRERLWERLRERLREWPSGLAPRRACASRVAAIARMSRGQSA